MDGSFGLAKMDSSRLTRPPERGLSRPVRVRTQPPCQVFWSWYVRG